MRSAVRLTRPLRRTPLGVAVSVAVRSAAIAAIGSAVACTPQEPLGAPAIAPRADVAFPAEWRLPAGAPATFAPNAMAVSNSRLASEAANAILERGGNAVDAAVALGFALAVTWPEAGNIGGGGYMVIRMADGRTAAIDYREIAPAAAFRDMYLDSTGTLTNKSIVGHLASGVPGAVAGMVHALSRYGTMSLEEVMQPAIALARDGFVVDSGLAQSIKSASERIALFEGGALFVPNGEPVGVGARLVQPDLARTLEAIATQGPDGFYKGWVADSLVAEMQRGGGIITLDDLAGYTPKEREPIRTDYRGFSLIAMPPSSSGGVTMTESLNILETWPTDAPYGSTAWFHRVGSAYQRAFIDRNSKLGDPDFIAVPLAQLTSKSYAAALRATISDMSATPTRVVDSTMKTIAEPTNTTHYSVVDRFGNAVATTTTLNGSWGSGVWVRGAGFFMNNEMDDFAAQPGMPNMFGLVQGEQNAIQPGKRMLSAMSPTIVLDSAQQVLLVVGAAGGPTIITGTSQVILNVIDHRMRLADAMRAPRIHHQALPDSLTFEIGGIPEAVQDSLRTMGWSLRPIRSLVNVNAIMRVQGGWEGVPEPRRVGGAVGH